MCGINGIFAYHQAASKVSKDELEKVRDFQATRGPDSSGLWMSRNNRVGFGHRRLSIIDLSNHADQPMICPAEGNVIVFNGEIYNYKRLKAQLVKEGQQFSTASDTEVLLKGYNQWGSELFSKLRGMYALAIWNKRASKLVLARDPYGIKPLYYSNDGKSFRFASTVKALLQGELHTRESDFSGLVSFLLLGSFCEPYTTHVAISSLKAGEYLEINQNGIGEPKNFCSVKKIWHNASAEPIYAEKGELQEIIDVLVKDSVKHHMIADVPVGAFLSSGIDSTVLTAIMSEMASHPIQTITLGFEDFKNSHNDETLLAERVAKQYGTSHETCWIADGQVEGDLPLILENMDQPSVDGINTWLVSKVAKDKGLKVVVSGLGGDELFGGYDHFEQIQKWSNLHKKIKSVPGAAQTGFLLTRLLNCFHLFPPKLPAVFRYGSNYSGLYFSRRGLFMPWEIEQILGKDMATEGFQGLQVGLMLELSKDEADNENAFCKIAELESSYYLKNQLLKDGDWASMAHSLELRTPLVDIHLLEQIAPYLVHPERTLKRKLGLAKTPSQPLPVEIINRKKSGFSLPLERWVSKSKVLQGWRNFPALRSDKTHWSRRLACALIADQVKSS